MNLVLFDRNGEVEVNVAAASLSAEDRQSFRSMAAKLIADFGKALVKFRVNGTVTDGPLFSSAGGSHGDRTH